MLDNLYQVLDKWLYIPRKDVVDVILATKIAIRLKSDPLWLIVKAPSSSGKTELIRAIQDEDAYFTNNLTAPALLSGYKDDSKKKKQDPKDDNALDLLPKLNNKVLLIPDLTNILRKPDAERNMVFAALQDCYDGGFSADFGSIGHKEIKARFGFITGCTEIIDTYAVKMGAFGQRFLTVQIAFSQTEEMEATSKAIKITGKEPDMRQEINDAMKAVMKEAKTRILTYNDLPLSPGVDSRIEGLTTAMAILRTGIVLDPRTGKGDYIAHHEMGPRVAKQLTNLGRCLACLYGSNAVGEREYRTLIKVARDCVPELRLQVISYLADWKSASELGNLLSMPASWLYSTLDQLYTLKLLLRRKDSEISYRLTDYYNEILSHTQLLNLQSAE